MRKVTDSAGVVVNSYDYDAYGNFESRIEAVANPYAFTSREYDPESGLYYYRARYYDANSGRFISEDPIGFAAGDANLYRYVFNNPVNFRDPSGLVIVDPNIGSRALDALRDLLNRLFPGPFCPVDPNQNPDDLLDAPISGSGPLMNEEADENKDKKKPEPKNPNEDKTKGKKAQDSSPGERHGDRDAVEKVQEQIDGLQAEIDRLKGTQEKGRKSKIQKLEAKIRNIRTTAQKKTKGETHHNR